MGNNITSNYAIQRRSPGRAKSFEIFQQLWKIFRKSEKLIIENQF